MHVKAVLLAGGRSIRMGRDKALLRIGGETLVERHTRQLNRAGVDEIVTVCNEENEGRLREIAGVRTVLQRHPDMSGAVLTGLEQVSGAAAVFLVCVNDLILDEDYTAIAAETADVVCATRTLDRAFHGGMLLLEGVRIRAIVEKPAGGCPPGSAANIMIHRVGGGAVARSLCERLRSGEDYESAITGMIAAGFHAVAAPVRFWLAIKTPEDYSEAQRRVSRNPGAAPENG